MNYEKLKKAELIEKLIASDKAYNDISDRVSELGSSNEELSKKLSELDDLLKEKDIEIQGLKDCIDDNDKYTEDVQVRLENIESTEGLEYKQNKAFKLVMSLEALIIVILIITLLV